MLCTPCDYKPVAMQLGFLYLAEHRRISGNKFLDVITPILLI